MKHNKADNWWRSSEVDQWDPGLFIGKSPYVSMPRVFLLRMGGDLREELSILMPGIINLAAKLLRTKQKKKLWGLVFRR